MRVVAVTARSRAKKRDFDLGEIALGRRSRRARGAIPRSTCFVELMGGDGDPAKRAVEAALAAGKSVVTANKALLAKHGSQARRARRAHGVALNFEAAVARRRSRSSRRCARGSTADRSTRVYGILNGTCNYILTRMEQERLRSPNA